MATLAQRLAGLQRKKTISCSARWKCCGKNKISGLWKQKKSFSVFDVERLLSGKQVCLPRKYVRSAKAELEGGISVC